MSMMRLMVCDGRIRMKRAERQMSRFSDAHRRFGRLEIAQLADQHDIRIFTKGRAQSLAEPVRVAVHFALVHQALLC